MEDTHGCDVGTQDSGYVRDNAVIGAKGLHSSPAPSQMSHMSKELNLPNFRNLNCTMRTTVPIHMADERLKNNYT